MQTTNIGCIVMAAGNASRFGQNKLAAEVDGKPLIRHALEAVPKEQFSRVAVVTQYPEIADMAREFGFEAIKNEHPDYGISHTIALGTKALSECDAILYMVSDQPLLDSASVGRVVSCWREHPQHIVGAAHNGKRGNPCIFPRVFYAELLALTEDHGGNSVIRCHPERLLTVEVAQKELTDVDTPEALRELRTQLDESSVKPGQQV